VIIYAVIAESLVAWLTLVTRSFRCLNVSVLGSGKAVAGKGDIHGGQHG
jgi:hypothetical protein